MDQRLRSKRWQLAVSGLLLFIIAALLLPSDGSKPRENSSPEITVKLPLEGRIDGTRNTTTNPHDLVSLGDLPEAAPIGAIQVTERTVGEVSPFITAEMSSTEISSDISIVAIPNPISQEPPSVVPTTTEPHQHPEVASEALARKAIFEEQIGEQPSNQLSPTHRNAIFDSRFDSTKNHAARLVEWRRLLGVQVPESLPESPPDEYVRETEAGLAQTEIAEDDFFSPLVIATVPYQDQYLRAQPLEHSVIEVAAKLDDEDDIVDDEGFWEPVATEHSGQQEPEVPESSAPQIMVDTLPAIGVNREVAQPLGTGDSLADNGHSLADNPASPDLPLSGMRTDHPSYTLQALPAIQSSTNASKQLILPAATPVFPQQADSEPNSADEKEEDPEATDEATSVQDQANSDDDKKMIGHVAGKFGTCLRSAISCGLYFGNEFTFLATETSGSTRIQVVDTLTDELSEYTGEDAFGFGNRLTLGIQAQNIGFRVIYWAYEAGYSGHDAWKDPEINPVFSTTSKVGLETVDIDLTQNYCFLGCDLISACGVRFAEYQGSEFSYVSSNLQDALETSGGTRSYRSLQGMGPTFFMEMRKTIPWCLGSPARMPYGMYDPGSTGCFGCCQSDCGSYGSCGGCGGCDSCNIGSPCFPWRFYANVRLSVLWADTYSESMTESVVATGSGITSQGIARGRDKASVGQDEQSSLMTTQLQVGLEHRTPILCNRALWICRLGLECQSWDTGQHQAMSESYAFLSDSQDGAFGGRVNTLSRADNRYLDLFGITFLLGLNY